MEERDRRFIVKILKTFEFAKVDKKLVKNFTKLIRENLFKKALALLENFNQQKEMETEISYSRPVLHGYDEDNIFTKLIQESYVTAKLFHVEDRLLNSIWSDDWQTSAPLKV